MSRVRVHDDALSRRAAAEIDARAFTHRNQIYLGAGERADDVALMAHELTHTLQQGDVPSSSDGITRVEPALARKAKEPSSRACGGWDCASTSDCEETDAGGTPSTEPSDDHYMRIFLDLDVASAKDISGADDVGHTYVKFSEDNGDKFTYGFYHNKTRTPDAVWGPVEVPGCVAHPDTTHWQCVDMEVKFDLTAEEYKKAMDVAQLWCKGAPKYHLHDRNCTTFVATVAAAAGKTLPSYRSKAGYGSLSTEADNPNALFDSYVSPADSETWRERVAGDFKGHFTHDGSTTSFTKFELKSNDTFGVTGEYEFTRSGGSTVKGTIGGHLEFKVAGDTKSVTPVLYFWWSEAGGASGLGKLTVSASGMTGTWGWDGESRGGGDWTVAKP